MPREKNQQSQAQNAPDYLAWHVTQKGEKSFWNKVGAAWAHKDGKGVTLQLETCPINGRMPKALAFSGILSTDKGSEVPTGASLLIPTMRLQGLNDRFGDPRRD